MSSSRTTQALRQVIYARLTSPAITYSVNDVAMPALTDINVSARPIWIPGVGGQPQPPTPYVCFSVGSAPSQSTVFSEREMDLKIWVSATSSDDEVTELYEAVRLRLQAADLEAEAWAAFPPDVLTRPYTSGASLGITIRRIREVRAMPADYNQNDARWCVSAHYKVTAV